MCGNLTDLFIISGVGNGSSTRVTAIIKSKRFTQVADDEDQISIKTPARNLIGTFKFHRVFSRSTYVQ